MNLTSSVFFLFLLVLFVLYYSMPSFQKYILLFGSIFFYITVSTTGVIRTCILIAYIGSITYFGGIIIDRCKGYLKSLVLFLCVTGIVGALVVLKYAYNITAVFCEILRLPYEFSWIKFAGIIGVSYYSLTAIGYLIDVYRNIYKAERKISDVLLFVFYFPQIISGPVTRFSDMHEKLVKKHRINYGTITLGMRRMAWGYFKKLVISERFAVIVSTVYGEYSKFSMIGIIAATICYAVQLYTDFSGCMDIIMGASLLFGVELPENFDAPFFSETLTEFWRRWHITLGTWFKDYVMYPIQKSDLMQGVGRWAKKYFGKKFGKKIPFYLSMVVLWTLIGIWHGGTGYYFIASGAIPCALLMLSDIMQLLFTKSRERDKFGVFSRMLRRLRTLLLVCISWIVVCSNGTYNFINVVRHVVTHPVNTSFDIDNLRVFNFGIRDMSMIVGLVVLCLADYLTYKGTSIFEELNKRNFWIRTAMIYLELLFIMMFGVMGTSSFIYFKF